MSQIVRIRVSKTQMQSRELLVQAIQEAGFSVEQRRFRLLGLKAEIKIRGRQVGFNKRGEFYEMVSRGEASAHKILQDISQNYLYRLTLQKLEAQGFALASQEVQKDGGIHLVLRRMA